MDSLSSSVAARSCRGGAWEGCSFTQPPDSPPPGRARCAAAACMSRLCLANEARSVQQRPRPFQQARGGRVWVLQLQLLLVIADGRACAVGVAALGTRQGQYAGTRGAAGLCCAACAAPSAARGSLPTAASSALRSLSALSMDRSVARRCPGVSRRLSDSSSVLCSMPAAAAPTGEPPGGGAAVGADCTGVDSPGWPRLARPASIGRRAFGAMPRFATCPRGSRLRLIRTSRESLPGCAPDRKALESGQTRPRSPPNNAGDGKSLHSTFAPSSSRAPGQIRRAIVSLSRCPTR